MNLLTYLGRPWQPVVFDCWGLVREVYRQELAIHLPAIPVDAPDFAATAHAFAHRPERRIFQVIEEPQPFCLAGMGRGKRLCHVGLYLDTPDGPRILHNERYSGVLCQRLEDLSTLNLTILGYYVPRGFSTQLFRSQPA